MILTEMLVEPALDLTEEAGQLVLDVGLSRAVEDGRALPA